MEFFYDAVDNDVLILSADGGLMAENTDEFVGELERYIDLGIRKLIVDCTRLKVITSSGLGNLVGLHKRLIKHGGDVRLAAVPGVVAKVMHMTGLGAVFHFYPTVEQARAAFGSDSDSGPSDDGVARSRHPLLD